MQLCPARRIELRAHCGAASAMSASACTMVGPLPPSSSATRRRPLAALISAPTRLDPVKVTKSTRGSRTSAGPTVLPYSRLTNPGGVPASANISASLLTTHEACGGALSTIELPAASAGAILWQARLNGALNGVMPATTPTGKRSSSASLPAPIALPSSGTCSPWMRIASSAESSSVSCERITSAFASLIDLPVSRDMISATASARSRSSALTRRNSAARS